ncbi:zinc knuckle CX2CX4HX4C containing protein [Tanacetum coccineum]|uniref:Zinc knuckle CX2CX4HX4C containing protein n=1 Tax=Tanacetum coccineum TaxID=301880 RepID=A0ABQ4XII7_9ASTR
MEHQIELSVDINKSTSYAGVAGGSAKDQPNVNSNFRTLVSDPVFDGINISIPRKVVEKVSTRFEHTLYGYFIGKRMAFPVVEYYARNNWAKHGLKRIMMNSKGFFFFKFDSRAGLEAVLEGGPWLIRKSPIILKKWSMWMLLLLVFHLFLRMILPKKPSVLSMNGGRPDVIHKRRKGRSKSTNGGQFTSPSDKHNVRYKPKATTSAPMKGTTYLVIHLNRHLYEEEVENVYDESANLILNTKAGGSSSFTAAAG